jgi:putative FmdB family regulatory protein
MPLYEFTCQDCNSEFEVLVRNGERCNCPACGSATLEKQFSIVAAHSGTSRQLPMCEAPAPGGGCGLPQCGRGQCGGM